MLRAKYYKGRLCDSHLSYEFFPTNPLQLPLPKVGKELEEQGLQMKIKTQYVLVFLVEGQQISLYPSGKILVKNVSVEEKANEIFHKIIEKLNRCPSIRDS